MIMQPQFHCQFFFGNIEISGKETKHNTDVFMLQAKKKKKFEKSDIFKKNDCEFTYTAEIQTYRHT